MGLFKERKIVGAFAADCVGILLLFSAAGCGGDVPEGLRVGKGGDGKSGPASVELVGTGGAGGDVTLREVPHAVEVELRMVGLPETGAVYVARIRGGTCAESRGEHGTDNHESGGHGPNGDGSRAMTGGVTEFPLSLLTPDGGGRGSSTTLLRRVSLKGLLSGKPSRHVSVSASGGAGPRETACADLGKGRG